MSPGVFSGKTRTHDIPLCRVRSNLVEHCARYIGVRTNLRYLPRSSGVSEGKMPSLP